MSALTSSTISVWPLTAADPQTPWPIGMRTCSVASGPFHGPSASSSPSTKYTPTHEWAVGLGIRLLTPIGPIRSSSAIICSIARSDCS